MNEAAPPTNRIWFKDFGYYTTGFVLIGVLLGFFTPTGPGQGGAFLAEQMGTGAAFGFVCAVAFTILQNGTNSARRKWLTWVLAIGTWVLVKVAVVLAAVAVGGRID